VWCPDGCRMLVVVVFLGGRNNSSGVMMTFWLVWNRLRRTLRRLVESSALLFFF